MTTVKQMLDAKGYDVWTIDPDQTVFEAITLMVEKGIGALVVVKDSRVVGIVSERRLHAQCHSSWTFFPKYAGCRHHVHPRDRHQSISIC